MFEYQADFEKHCNRILVDRSELYGEAWKGVGLQGAVIEIHAKRNRLKKLVLHRDYGEQFEARDVLAIRDSLADLRNYCVIANECLTLGLWYVGESEKTVEQRKEITRELLEGEG